MSRSDASAPGNSLDDATAALLAELGSATLYEASGRECFLPPRLRPAWEGAAVVGVALPVTLAPGDNLPLHLALEVARPRDVLVVDGGDVPHGYWGEVLTVAAQAVAISGLVIDGGVRDTRELEYLGFPVFSSHVALQGTVKSDAGRIGDPIRWGALTVEHGDVIVGDADGIISLPSSSVHGVIMAAQRRHAKERDFISRLRGGATTMELYGFARPTVAHS